MISLALLTLAEPTVSVLNQKFVKPTLSVLVDRSRSMAVVESGSTRIEKVSALLQDAQFQQYLDNASVTLDYVADTVQQVGVETLYVFGNATNLAEGIRNAAQRLAVRREAGSILVISDGAHNLGEDPVGLAKEMGIPVHTLSVGSPEAEADLRIVRATAAETAYIGGRLMITTEVKNRGFEGRSAELFVIDGGDTLVAKRVTLAQAGQTQSVALEIKPSNPGTSYYRVQAKPMEGESNTANNEALTFARILGSRINVLLVAGAPSHEFAFLSRSLLADSSLTVTTLVYKKGSAVYENQWASLPSFDVLVLSDVPLDLISERMLRSLQDQVRQGDGLLVTGGSRAYQMWRVFPEDLQHVLPIKPSLYVSKETPLRAAPDGHGHPVLSGLLNPWADLAPLSGYVTVQETRGVPVLCSTLENNPPLLVVGSYGAGKVIAALSSSFWRANFVTRGTGGQTKTMRQLWQNSVRWLGQKEQSSRIYAATDRRVYRAGEPLTFIVRVFDEFARPQDNAEVTVSMESSQVSLEEIDKGEYRATWESSGLEPGTHTFAASARINQNTVGAVRGEFAVEHYSIEDGDLRADALTLQRMSEMSGGRHARVDDWQVLMQALNLQIRIQEESQSFVLRGSTWPMVVILTMLAVEWVARKRVGMI